MQDRFDGDAESVVFSKQSQRNSANEGQMVLLKDDRIYVASDAELEVEALSWCKEFDVQVDDPVRTYRIFSGIQFGMAPVESHKELIHELLPMRKQFAIDQYDIGCVSAYEFELSLYDDTPIHSKPIKYMGPERLWIKDYCKEMCAKGIIKPISDTNFSSPVVLVPQGQTGQDFRFCVNYKRLNAKTRKVQFELPEIQDILDQLAGSKCFTSIDLKAGYHNIPIHAQSQEYTTFITQDGSYCWVRLPFGLSTAPHFFQKTVQAIVQVDVHSYIIVYLDDICVHGPDWQTVWRYTLDAIRRLVSAGFMINIKKTQLLRDKIIILGNEVSNSHVRPNAKKVQLLLSGTVPKTFKDVQSLVGLLNYFRRFVPHFAKQIAPISNLLKQESPQWTGECDTALQGLIQYLASSAELALPVPSKAFSLALSVGEGALSVVLLQEKKPVGFASRELTQKEMEAHPLVVYVEALHFALDKFRQYIAYAPELSVESPEPALGPFIKRDNHAPRIQGLVADIWTYPISSFRTVAPAVEAAVESQPSSGHVISVPRAKGAPTVSLTDKRYHIYFDGGARRQQTTGGFVIFKDGVEVVRAGRQYALRTNNEAEVQAAREAIDFAIDHVYEHDGSVGIVGDSQLIIRFFNKEYVPKADFLYNSVQHALRRARTFQKVGFFHLPREQNTIADQCARDAREVGDFILYPEEEKVNNFVGSVRAMEGDPIWGSPCIHCNQLGNEKGDDMILCDQCNNAAHLGCIGAEQVPLGFWFCSKCRRQQYFEGTSDVTQDSNLMYYLFHGEMPLCDSAESDRILSGSTRYSVQGSALYYLDHEGELREVPPIADRLSIIKVEHDMRGHPGFWNLYNSLKRQYFWPRMKSQIMFFLGTCVGCQGEKVQYQMHPTLLPTNKPTLPFQAWSVDLITGLKPPSDISGENSSCVIVCVDYFSKWVELGVLANKSAFVVARWFFFNVVCRYGRPLWIRCDQGTEFRGRFAQMVKDLGVKQCVISPRHPRSNGLVERYNRGIKASIRKYLLQHPDTVWEEWLGEIAFGLRTGYTRAHGFSPYMVALKQEALLPTRLQHLAEPEQWDVDVLSEAELTERLFQLYVRVRESAVARLGTVDEEYARYYAAKVALDARGIDFVLAAGDKVFIRQRKVGKLLPKTEGVWVFQRYFRGYRTAQVLDPSGRSHKINVEEILPAP